MVSHGLAKERVVPPKEIDRFNRLPPTVQDLEKAIQEFFPAWNEKPKPFVWTATVESIVEKLSRRRQTLQKVRPGCAQPRKRKEKMNCIVVSRTLQPNGPLWRPAAE